MLEPERKAASDSDIRELSTPALVRGLLEDARLLIAQEAESIKVSLEQQITSWRTALALAAIGGSAVVLGSFVLMLGLARLLQAGLALPLWASYMVIGLLFVGTGATLIIVGKLKTKQVTEDLADAAQQPIQDVLWITENQSKKN
jgi:hypothetical protein